MDPTPGKSYDQAGDLDRWDKASPPPGEDRGRQGRRRCNAAVKGGDKTAITAAFGDMGKNGCGGCHEPYREKKPS